MGVEDRRSGFARASCRATPAPATRPARVDRPRDRQPVETRRPGRGGRPGVAPVHSRGFGTGPGMNAASFLNERTGRSLDLRDSAARLPQPAAQAFAPSSTTGGRCSGRHGGTPLTSPLVDRALRLARQAERAGQPGVTEQALVAHGEGAARSGRTRRRRRPNSGPREVGALGRSAAWSARTAARLRVTGGANTQASAVPSPAVQRQPYSCTTSATSSLILMRWPLRCADTSPGSSPRARVTAAGSTWSQKGARGTTSAVVSTSWRGVPLSTASLGAAVGGGSESVEPEQPASAKQQATTTARMARAASDRRTGVMPGD